MPIPRPEVLSYDDLRTNAAAFLGRHWPSGRIPVDVEYMADVELGIDIVPVSDLLAVTDVDGFLAADGKELYVDEGVYKHQMLYRYRFTVAHELAHLELHRTLLNAADFKTPDEWRQFQGSIPEQDRSWFEWQAYAFAGLILVPPEPLVEQIRVARNMARETGFDVDLEVEAHRTYLAEWVGRRFEVSAEVILRRGAYDEHWNR